jgi:hypothetical protein
MAVTDSSNRLQVETVADELVFDLHKFHTGKKWSQVALFE